MTYPHFNPIALSLGPLSIHWYGLMYLFGFAAVWALARYRMKTQAWSPISDSNQLVDLIYWGALGVVIGGRVGYMLFYAFPDFIQAPWIIFEVWQGGMSFHGGLVGVILLLLIFARRHKIALLRLTDFVAPMVPIGLGLGRFGNFINGELWGRVTDSYFGMIFPNGGPFPRYPTELFECALEGVMLFVFLWLYSLKKRPTGHVSGLFLLGYSVARFAIEFLREPDAQLGYLAWDWLTMGQILCIPMFILGLYLLARTEKKPFDSRRIHKILVLEFCHIGDTMIHEPTLRAMKLAFPKAQFYALTDQANFDALVTHPAFFKVEVFNRKIRSFGALWGFLKGMQAIRAEKFDLLVNFYRGGITPKIARLSRIPYRLAYGAKKLVGSYNMLAKNPTDESNWVVESTELLRPLGVDPASVWPEPQFFIPHELVGFEKKYLAPNTPYVCYNLGTSVPAKCWPVSKYVALAVELYREKGWVPVLIANPGQMDLVDAFLQAYPPDCPFVRLPVLRFYELAVVLKATQLLITGDTGVMHLGFGVRLPTAAIFTHTPPHYVVSATTQKMVIFREDEHFLPALSNKKYGVVVPSVAEVRDAIEKLLVFCLKSS